MASEHQAISQHQVEQEETTIDLAELFYRLLDKAKFIIVAALLGAIIAFCVTKFFMCSTAAAPPSICRRFS